MDGPIHTQLRDSKGRSRPGVAKAVALSPAHLATAIPVRVVLLAESVTNVPLAPGTPRSTARR